MREFLFYNCFMYINKKNPTIIAAAWYNRNKNSSCSRLSFLTIVFNDLVWKTLTNVSKLSWCYLSDGKLVKSSHRAVSDDFPLVCSTFLHQLFLSTIILTDSATHTLWVRMGGGRQQRATPCLQLCRLSSRWKIMDQREVRKTNNC